MFSSSTEACRIWGRVTHILKHIEPKPMPVYSEATPIIVHEVYSQVRLQPMWMQWMDCCLRLRSKVVWHSCIYPKRLVCPLLLSAVPCMSLQSFFGGSSVADGGGTKKHASRSFLHAHVEILSTHKQRGESRSKAWYSDICTKTF